MRPFSTFRLVAASAIAIAGCGCGRSAPGVLHDAAAGAGTPASTGGISGGIGGSVGGQSSGGTMDGFGGAGAGGSGGTETGGAGGTGSGGAGGAEISWHYDGSTEPVRSGGTATGGAGGSATGGSTDSGGTKSGTGGMPASGATTATGGTPGGRTTCSWNQPCATGLCVGDFCGLGTCIVDGRDCTGSLIDYCGCDGVSFQDSSTCPKRPYAYLGACGQGPNCDQREVLCETTTPTCGQGQVPRVVGNCYDGTCISINQCSCTVAEECPDSRNYTCLSLKRCSPWLH